jgi:membrane protease YdiL (CAAX protease family)
VASTVVALRRADPRIAVGLGGLAVAAGVRMAVAGTSGAASLPAGVVFAALVAAVAALTRDGALSRPRVGPVVVGGAGALVLCVPAALRHAADGAASWSASGYLPWAVVVVAVASAEEALLRGSLYRAVEQRAGAVAAVALTSVAFALLHVPLYGWGVVPLDLAVGVWLGVLRAVSGSVVAPAVAHSLADLAGWWLR